MFGKVLHVGARINSLRDTILSYSDTCPHSRLQSKKKLKLVWEEHAKIMKFAKLLNEAFSFMSLVQVVGSILVICLTGFVIITVRKKKNIFIGKLQDYFFSVGGDRYFALCEIHGLHFGNVVAGFYILLCWRVS